MKDFTDDLEKSLEVLREGGVILYPTDTIWGLGCDATDAEAIEKIYALKNRPASKSFIVLVADERDILKYVSALDLQVFDYLDQTKKPTTVIYEGAVGLPENLIGSDGTIGIRLVQDPFCKHLIKRLRKPLVSTSANKSGEPGPSRFSEISPEIKSQVDYIVNYRQSENSTSQPSTVVKWNGNGSVTVIRE